MHRGQSGHTIPRILQQQPEHHTHRENNRQQQQSSGSGEYQPRQMGADKKLDECTDLGPHRQELQKVQNPQAAKDYQKNIKAYLERADLNAKAVSAAGPQ